MKILHPISSAVVAGALALGLTFGVSAPAIAAGVLTSPEPDWTGGQVTCKIIQILLEDELGYKVKRITIPAGAGVYEGIRSGDLDYACEGWPTYNSSKEKYMTEYGGDGTVAKLGDAGIVGVSGYYVPRYLVEGDGAAAPDLKKFTDLANYVDLFKTLETGDKGRLLGCPVAAWECDDQKRTDLLGVNFVAAELGSETAHWAEIQAAYARKEPFVAYAWEPHWIHAELDLVPLELPEYDADKWPATTWAVDVTYNYGSPDLIKEHPDAAQLIINSSLSNSQQAGMIHAIDVGGRELEEVVREWLAANEDVWRPWLP